MDYFNKYEKYMKNMDEILNGKVKDMLSSYFKLLLSNALPRGYIGDASEELLWQRHILDSLLVLQNKEIIELLKNSRTVVDLGSGAGLPGIVLAIIFTNSSFYLVESMQKRCIFLNECVEDLVLKNITVINKRAEDISKHDILENNSDVVLFRAFLKPLVSLELALNIVNQKSKVLYWRSRRFDISDNKQQSETEQRLDKLGFRVNSFVTLDCPEDLGSRGYYLFDFTGKPALGFPRNWSKIKNDSLCNKVI